MSKSTRGTNPPDFWCMNTGVDDRKINRSWEDCKAYGFMIAGGKPKFQDLVRSLSVGDRLFAYLNGRGFVGLGKVIANAVPQSAFVPPGHIVRLIDLPLAARVQISDDPAGWDWCVAVRWTYAVDGDKAVCHDEHRRATLTPIRDVRLTDRLIDELGRVKP